MSTNTITLLSDEYLQSLITLPIEPTSQQVHMIIHELLLARRVVEVAHNLCCSGDVGDYFMDVMGHINLEDALDTYDNTRHVR